jgi:hypothetical protein
VKRTTIERITGHLDETTLACLPSLVWRGFYRLRRQDGGKEDGGKEKGGNEKGGKEKGENNTRGNENKMAGTILAATKMAGRI